MSEIEIKDVRLLADNGWYVRVLTNKEDGGFEDCVDIIPPGMYDVSIVDENAAVAFIEASIRFAFNRVDLDACVDVIWDAAEKAAPDYDDPDSDDDGDDSDDSYFDESPQERPVNYDKMEDAHFGHLYEPR